MPAYPLRQVRIYGLPQFIEPTDQFAIHLLHLETHIYTMLIAYGNKGQNGEFIPALLYGLGGGKIDFWSLSIIIKG